jgi:hypothetical protein
MEKFKELKELISSIEKDATSFYQKGNKAAGTRLRIALQKSKTLAQEVRADVTSRKKA